jgi:hypothetical protein
LRFFRGSVIPVWVGALVAGLLIWAMEVLGSLIYPPPPGMNPDDPASVKTAMANLPAGALLLVLLGWIVGTFAGAWITALRADRAPIGHGLVLGGLFLVGAVVNMLMIPHPVWFWILGVAIFLPSAFLGAKLGARSRPVAPSPTSAGALGKIG